AESGLRERIVNSVQTQAVSDVPVGSLLSGGIDSTIITSILAEIGKISSFTIGFDDPESDERAHARLVADLLHTDHYEQVLNYEGACSLLPGILEAYDEPFHLNSLFPFY